MPATTTTLPALESGDHLTRAEFHRRYCARPDIKRAELVEGVVYIEGAPQLVMEIAASSASYDLHEKLRVYRRNGVPEYVVWRVFDGAVNWYRLEAGEYVLVELDEHSVIESTEFPGLRLNVPKLLAELG
ncbi:MAG: hypothetical protein QOF51_3710 [Chloroflexota bacterium]|jgi:Uma2 family endonuclease|nr:hypothetical protein [Chloroflexota bacterium]